MCLVERIICADSTQVAGIGPKSQGISGREPKARKHLPTIPFPVANLQTQQAGPGYNWLGEGLDCGERGLRQGMGSSVGLLSGLGDCPHLSTSEGTGSPEVLLSLNGASTFLNRCPALAMATMHAFLLPESQMP